MEEKTTLNSTEKITIKTTRRSSLDLDFSLQTDMERSQYVEKLFAARGPNWTPTSREQDIIANYLLYGIDESGKSPI